jgi:hypothetical protein
MTTSNSPPDLVSQLIRRGLPVEYAQRAAAEIADHHRDLVAELRADGFDEVAASDEASRRLGDPCTLVKKTVREYQRRYWCGRWPLLTFLFGPIALMLLAWVATGLFLFCVGWPLQKLGIVGTHERDGIISIGEWAIDRAVLVWFLFAVPATVIWVIAKLARQAALRWQWVGVAACVLAISASMVRSGFPDPALHPTTMDGQALMADTHVLTLGLPVFAPDTAKFLSNLPQFLWNWFTRDLKQTAQLLFPLIVAAGVLLRARQLSLRAQRLAVDGR